MRGDYQLKGKLISGLPIYYQGNEQRSTPLISSVQFSSVAQSCPALCNPIDYSTQTSLSITNSWSLLKLMSIELVMPSNHLILCHPLLLPLSIFLRLALVTICSEFGAPKNKGCHCFHCFPNLFAMK